MFENQWTKLTEQIADTDYSNTEEPYFTVVESGTILPSKPSNLKTWGLGGAVDSDGNLVEACVGRSFGGYYEADMAHALRIHETVYYVPVVPRHWGHFLVDVLSRLWFVVDQDEGYRIAFCGEGWPEDRITGNYLQALTYLGVEEERLLFVDQVMRFDRIIIPSATFGASDEKTYQSFRYQKVINRITQSAMASSEVTMLNPIKRIYFTRTGFYRAKVNEIGEKEIERMFQKNGYTIISPEKKSLSEQIFYFQTAEEVVSLSGTIPHNIVFAGENTQLIILNRTCVPNYTQLKLNQMFHIPVTYVDCYSKWTEQHPRTYGGKDGGPIWVEVTEELMRFMKDRGLFCEEPGTIVHLKNIVEFLKISGRIRMRNNQAIVTFYRKLREQ